MISFVLIFNLFQLLGIILYFCKKWDNSLLKFKEIVSGVGLMDVVKDENKFLVSFEIRCICNDELFKDVV